MPGIEVLPSSLDSEILLLQQMPLRVSACIAGFTCSRLINGSLLAVQSVRQKLYDELTKINKDRDWSFILKQIGALSTPGKLTSCRNQDVA